MCVCPFEGDTDASNLHKAILEVGFRCRAADAPPSYLPFKGADLRGAFMVSVCLDQKSWFGSVGILYLDQESYFGSIGILYFSKALTSIIAQLSHMTGGEARSERGYAGG